MEASEIMQKRMQERRARKAQQRKVQNRDEIRATRGRFNEAIREGATPQEAARIASGGKPAKTTKLVTPPKQPESAAVDIPDDWESMHWRTQVKLAESISGTKIEVNSDANEKAKAIIAAAKAAQG